MNGEDLYRLLNEENAKELREWNPDTGKYEHTNPQYAWPFVDRKHQRVFNQAARRLGDRRVRKTYKND